MYLAIQVLPHIIPFFWTAGYTRFFYENLGLSQTLASFLGHVCSYVFGAIWVPLVGWTMYVAFRRFDARKFALGLIGTIILSGHLSLLLMLFGSEVCANQRTGEPLKWYVVESGGSIVLYDSPGFDKAGTVKRPATAQVCRIRDLQKQGIQPHTIKSDPRSMEFFSGMKEPRVWYSKATDGRIDLFDAEGTNPATGELLKPVTPEIAQEARDVAAATQRAAETAAQIAIERSAAEARDRAHRDLAELFGTASYANGVVIVGVASRQKDDAANETAQRLRTAIVSGLRAEGLVVDEFRPPVYASGSFDKLLNGSTVLLSDSGLSKIMRDALLAGVDTSCHPATGIAGTYSCSISIELRVVRPTGTASSRRWTETGAGQSASQAAARAMELLIERNSDWLDGI